MKQVLVGLQPQNLEDVIALISLYRPGPMDSIPTYLRNRHEPDKIGSEAPQAGPHSGCDQWLHRLIRNRSCRSSGSWQASRFGQADDVRRAMSKKKHAVMEAERERCCPRLHQTPATSARAV